MIGSCRREYVVSGAKLYSRVAHVNLNVHKLVPGSRIRIPQSGYERLLLIDIDIDSLVPQDA